MVGYLYDYLDKVYNSPDLIKFDNKGNVTSSHTINLDIVGFSRGAASARMFADKVQKIMSDSTGKNNWYAYDYNPKGNPKDRVSRDWLYTTQFLQNCGINFNFNFMGLYDTVPAFGLKQDNDMSDIRAFNMDLDVSDSNFKTIVHAVAVNENRAEFARRSIYANADDADAYNDKAINGKYRLEQGFMGAHSDIGGGYANGDLSNASLMWMIKQAEKKGGIGFGNYDKYKQINNPIVHDNLWSMPLSSI